MKVLTWVPLSRPEMRFLHKCFIRAAFPGGWGSGEGSQTGEAVGSVSASAWYPAELWGTTAPGICSFCLRQGSWPSHLCLRHQLWLVGEGLQTGEHSTLYLQAKQPWKSVAIFRTKHKSWEVGTQLKVSSGIKTDTAVSPPPGHMLAHLAPHSAGHRLHPLGRFLVSVIFIFFLRVGHELLLQTAES